MISMNNRVFGLKENSATGQVKEGTLLFFKQSGNQLRAKYTGPDTTQGHIIGILTKSSLTLVYHCESHGQLLVGKAEGRIGLNADGKFDLFLNWQWLSGKEGKGNSMYSEISGHEI